MPAISKMVPPEIIEGGGPQYLIGVRAEMICVEHGGADQIYFGPRADLPGSACIILRDNCSGRVAEGNFDAASVKLIIEGLQAVLEDLE